MSHDLPTPASGTPLALDALDAVDQSLCVVDVRAKDQPLVYVNQAFERTTGFTAESALGRNCRFLQEGLDVRAQARVMRTAIEEQRSVTLVVTNRRADGTVFENELSLSPMRDASGSLTHYAAVQRDVTERVGRERELALLALENAEVADQLQRSLAPSRLVDVAGYDLAVRYRAASLPGGARGAVSGDFYDVVEGRDGHFLIIGDVSGRGPRAAAAAQALRWSLRGVAAVASGPADLLERLGEVALDALEERFVTMAVLGVESSGRTRLSLAGHPQPLLVSPTGRVRPVGLPGTLLGPVHAEVFDDEIEMSAGDQLALYTDGVTEAMGPGRDLFGEERLASVLAANTGGVQEKADAVLDAVRLHVGSGAFDDLTLLVVGREEIPAA